jgi:hypothetical protein
MRALQEQASRVKITRAWAMPSSETFTIKPIRKLLNRYVGDGMLWADPFAGSNSPAEFTNDLDPKTNAKDHELAKDWVQKLPFNLKGALFDPPYSYRQVTEHYRAVGRKAHQDDTNNYFYSSVRHALAPKIRPGGLAICFGWNSQGFGKNNGFELIELLIVCHGFHHNDTLCTVERKVGSCL